MRKIILTLALTVIAGLAHPQISPAPSTVTVTVAVSGDPGHLNPAISTAGPLHAVADSLYNGLIALDQTGKPQPDLARAWQIAPDGLTATFYLTSGARWHDGSAVTSRDVKFTFEEALFRFHARARSGLAPAVAAIETPDPGTVVFRLHRPYPALLGHLDVTEAPILPQHIHAGSDLMRSPANLKPVGSGPFTFESYRKDDQVVLVRNEHYFKPGKPEIDRLVFRIIPDAATQTNALLAGEVDMLTRVSAIDARRLKGQPVTLLDTKSGAGGANCIMTLAFNLDRPRISDIKVRQAFARTIDRDRILRLVTFGQGRIATAPIGSGIEWAHLAGILDRYSPDPAAANALLDQAGLTPGADGLRATFDIVHFPIFARYSEALRQQLATVGIALRVRMQDPAALADSVFTQRDFDLALISYCNGSDPEIGVRRMYHSSAIGAVPFSNAAAYRDGEIDRLFDFAGSTNDQDERSRAYHAIQRRLADSLPYWWLVETDMTAAWRDNFTGFAPWSGQFAENARRVK